MNDKFIDLFSNHAEEYKKFRPRYPKALFEYLASLCPNQHMAWDCGTGNGQAAEDLADCFQKVYATDASSKQIANAIPKRNIDYQVATAEESGLADNSVALITVFQALHWFNYGKFFTETKRVLQANGILAIIGYHTVLTGNPIIDQVYQDFCFNFLWDKHCWAMERNSLNTSYETVEFPFAPEMITPEFSSSMSWSYNDYLAYLNTWSAVKTYIKKYDENPVDVFVKPKIESAWQDKESAIDVRFPLLLRVGKIQQ